jgi:hypothetical protein
MPTYDFGATVTKPGEVNWNVINKLMDIDTKNNRIDRQGPFGGWNWSQDEETGRWTQGYQPSTPGMQSAMDRMDWRLQGGGFTPQQVPGQLGSITDALMADKMHRQGILDPNEEDPSWSLKQTMYGTRAFERPGSAWMSQFDTYNPDMYSNPTPPPWYWEGNDPGAGTQPVNPDPTQPTDPIDVGPVEPPRERDPRPADPIDAKHPNQKIRSGTEPVGDADVVSAEDRLRYDRETGGDYASDTGFVGSGGYYAPNTTPISELPDNYTNKFFPEVGGAFTQLRDNPAYAYTGTEAAQAPTNEQGQIFSPLLGWYTPKSPTNTTY